MIFRPPLSRHFAQVGYDLPALAEAYDWFNVMDYDYHGAWENFTGETVVLYCTVLYCTVLYCTVLHCTVLQVRRLDMLELLLDQDQLWQCWTPAQLIARYR